MRLLTGLLVMFSLLWAPLTRAALIELDPVDSGEIHFFATGDLFPPYDRTESFSHREGLESLWASQWASILCLCYEVEGTSGYMIYDLSGVAGDVTSVSLLLDVTLRGSLQSFPEDKLYISVMDVIDAGSLAALPPGPLDPALGALLFQDFDEGPLRLGSTAISDGSGSYQVELNPAALERINAAAGGLFALGIKNPGTASDEARVTFDSAPRLVLDTPIPLPATTSLLLVALALLLQRRNGLLPAWPTIAVSKVSNVWGSERLDQHSQGRDICLAGPGKASRGHQLRLLSH